MKMRRIWGLQLLLAPVLLISLSSCSDPADPVPEERPVDTTAPVIIASSQSATQMQPHGSVTFGVTAQDEETSRLHFSWTANVGAFGDASNTGTTSEIIWDAPFCVPAGTVVTITVTVTNSADLSVSKSFTLSAGPCPALTVTSVKAGSHFTLALRIDGTVWGWGFNEKNQLGDGTTTQRTTPVRVSVLTNVTALAAKVNHSLALRGDGTAWAWGNNPEGQLGDGTTALRVIPVQVSGLTGAAALAVGSNYSLALGNDGTVWAWGDNSLGQFGDGTEPVKSVPVRTLLSWEP